MFAKGFEKVAHLFDEMLYKQQMHTAAQMVVLLDGQPVVDHAVGVGPNRWVNGDTPFLCFSISKAFTGLCIHKLIEEGKVDLDAPVSEYWPEFGRLGKETATIRHVFLHQAGIPAPRLARQLYVWPFWRLVMRNVAATPAVFPPGSQTAYHVVNYGFIFGEIVYRVTGMHIEEYLRQNFIDPLCLENTWLRIPLQQLFNTPRLVPIDPTMRRAAGAFNLPWIRQARIPAASLHSTARELAVTFQMLLQNGEYGGKRLLQPETVRAATTSGYNGWDDYIKSNMNWGYGFIMGGGEQTPEDSEMHGMGRDCKDCTFGAFGMGSSMVWADRDARLVVAFTCNGMMNYRNANRRWAALSNAVWDCLQEV